jgi:hypothetical protein
MISYLWTNFMNYILQIFINLLALSSILYINFACFLDEHLLDNIVNQHTYMLMVSLRFNQLWMHH